MSALSIRLRALSAFLAAASLAALLAACTKNPAAEDTSSKDGETAAKAQADADSAAAVMLLPAYQLNREAASHARLASLKGPAEQPKPHAPAASPAFGPLPAGTAKGLAPRPQPQIAAALLKRSALGKASAAQGADSSWYAYADSSQGNVLWVHAYLQSEAGVSVEARDTLVYKWPMGAGRTVLGHTGARAYANGARLTYVVSDEDGDGLLNEAAPGTKIRLRKVWTTTHGDTTWKSDHHTVHGSTNLYDSIGPGADTGWTDTVFVGGKTVSWQRIMDGDKDGFVATAAPGKAVRINRDSYSELGNGVFRLDYESFGPGADGDFLAAADNERYPYRSQTIDAAGHTLATTRYGDADGDGFVFDPAAAAGHNRAWIVNQYPAGDSAKAWSDSLAEILSGPGGGDAKITYYGAAREYLDGRKLAAFARIPGSGAFGGADTVQIWEKWDLSARQGGSDPDSTLKVTWVIPGVLGDPGDDEIAKTYYQAWNKAGQASVSVSELLTADVPFAPGGAPASGTWTREERRNPVSSKSIVRSVQYQEFDADRGAADWRRTDYFESGDSAVSQGGSAPGGEGSYVQALGQGARSAGTYDAATGAFADTTAFLGPKGEARAREIAWGQVDAAKGTCDYRVKRLGGKDTATAHITAVAEGGGLALMRVAGADTLRAHLEGDSAVLVKTVGGVKRTYAWTAAAGANRVAETDAAADGTALASGEYYFGQDLSGKGTLKKTPPGKAAAESQAQFLSDGSLYLDGLRVYP